MMSRATVLMNDLLVAPEGFFNHVRRYTASVAAAIVFGHRGPTFESFWAHVSIDILT
jgi:hypothetical protein